MNTIVQLFLIRHGIAEDRRPGLADGDRQLTDEGRRRLRKIAKALVKLDIGFDAIYSSPLRRAIETAEIVASILPSAPNPRQHDSLRPMGRSEPLMDAINSECGTDAHVLLVGHEPDLGQMIRTLIGASSTARLDLRKGGLVRLAIADGPLALKRCATLDWWVAPRLLIDTR